MDTIKSQIHNKEVNRVKNVETIPIKREGTIIHLNKSKKVDNK